jgi:hypothetical protein
MCVSLIDFRSLLNCCCFGAFEPDITDGGRLFYMLYWYSILYRIYDTSESDVAKVKIVKDNS